MPTYEHYTHSLPPAHLLSGVLHPFTGKGNNGSMLMIMVICKHRTIRTYVGGQMSAAGGFEVLPTEMGGETASVNRRLVSYKV